MQRQRQHEPENEESHKIKTEHDQHFGITSDIESKISSVRGNGQPLTNTVRSLFEQKFGCDLSDVRVHMDATAAKAAESVKAKAFTIDRDVVFGTEQYKPNTDSGKRLIAHELVHVVQQTKKHSVALQNNEDVAKREAKSSGISGLQSKKVAELVKNHNTGLLSRHVGPRYQPCCSYTLPTPRLFGLTEDGFANVDIYARSDHGFGYHTTVTAISQDVYAVEFQLRTNIPIRVEWLHGARLISERRPSPLIRRFQVFLRPGSQWRIWYGPIRSQASSTSFIGIGRPGCVPCTYQLIGEGERLMP